MAKKKSASVNDEYQPPSSVTRKQVLDAGADERFRQAIYALFVTGTRFDEIREAFGREIGTTGPQYFILVAIARWQNDGGVGTRVLADYLGVAASHVTVEVGKLIDKKLLQKRSHPEDGRRVLITLTQQGMDTLARLAPLRQDINDILFEGMTRDEFDILARLLNRFVTTTARAQHELARREQEKAFLTAAE